jgi:hypothetical protein
MGLSQGNLVQRWARSLFVLCALALTAACSVLEGPYTSDRDWPFGADVNQVTLIRMKDGTPDPASEKLTLSRSSSGLRWQLEGAGDTTNSGQFSIKFLGVAPLGRVYGYAVPHSDLPVWPEIAGKKIDGVRGDEFAAFAVYGRIILLDQTEAHGRAQLGFAGPLCPKTIEPNCVYDTSAAVWAALAATVPEMTLEDMSIYDIQY